MSSDNQFYKEALLQVQRDSERALYAQRQEQEAFLKQLEREQDEQLKGFSEQIAQLTDSLIPHLKGLQQRLTALETPQRTQERSQDIIGSDIAESHTQATLALRQSLESQRSPCSVCGHGLYRGEQEANEVVTRFVCLLHEDTADVIECTHFESHDKNG